MRLRRNLRVRATLVDGTTLEGTVRRSWAWWILRLGDVSVFTGQGQAEAAGLFTVPKRSILFVQILHGMVAVGEG